MFRLNINHFSTRMQVCNLQVHNQLMTPDFVGVQASRCLPSINNVWIPCCSEALRQTNTSFRRASRPWNPIPVRCVDSGTKTCSYRPQRDGHFADMTQRRVDEDRRVSRHVTLTLLRLFLSGSAGGGWDVVLKCQWSDVIGEAKEHFCMKVRGNYPSLHVLF